MALQILVPLHTYPEGNSDAIAAHVAMVAGQLGADVLGLVVNPAIPTPSSMLGGGLINVDGMIREVTARCEARGAALVRAMDGALGAKGIAFRTGQLKSVMGVLDAAVDTHARYCDLIVTGLCPDDPALERTAETLVFASGQPTLLVPENLQPTPCRHLMIAWDGSRVASRAVADARDFLGLATKVTIAVVTDEKVLPPDDPGLKLAEHLHRRGIQSSVSRVLAQRQPVGQALQGHALAIGADMMVMGAFGHSRLRDFVVGGATAGVLKDLKLPILMSH